MGAQTAMPPFFVISRSDVADAADVDVAVLLREAELAREVLADEVAVEDRDRPAAQLQQLDQQCVRDGRLARARESREEDREALPVARRMAAPELGGHVSEREPLGDVASVGQALPELGARDVQRALPFRHLVDRHVRVEVLDVDHHLERHHRDAQLRLVLPEQVLCVVGPVERRAARVAARPGVIAADDEVRAAVVLADDGVPDRLARPAHPHREGQQRQHRRLARVAVQQRLVAAHPRVVIDVPRLGHPHDGVDQQVRLRLLGRAQGQLLVGAVHRVAGLEGDHLRPTQLAELRPELGRTVPQQPVVVVRDGRDARHPSAHVAGAHRVQQMRHARVLGVRGAEHRLGLRLTVRPPHVLDRQCGDHDALLVAQGEARAWGELAGEVLRDVQRDRDRPQRAALVREPHLRADPLVVGARHETGERREPAAQQQLEVADLARRQVVRRPVARGGLQGPGAFVIDEQIDERPAVRGDEMV